MAKAQNTRLQLKNQPVTSETPEKACTSETPKTPEETDNQL